MSSIIKIISNTGTSIIKVNTSTVSQRVNTIWYTAGEGESNSLLLNGSVILYQNGGALSEELSDLTGKTVIAVNRENYELQPTEYFPTNKQFSWAGETPTLTFANDLEVGEQIKITYV